MIALNQFRRSLYRTTRVLGDVNAVSRGPGALGRRVVRKAAYRGTNGVLRAVLRSFGL